MGLFLDAERLKKDGYRLERTVVCPNYACTEIRDVLDKDLVIYVEEINASIWYGVNDQPPPAEEEVIVSIKDDSGDTPWYYTTVGWYSGDGNKWVVDNAFTTKVQFWQPLPKPNRSVKG